MMGSFVDKLHDSSKIMSEEQQQSMNVALSLAENRRGRRSSTGGSESTSGALATEVKDAMRSMHEEMKQTSGGGDGLSGELATEMREAMQAMHEEIKLLRKQMVTEISKLKSSEPLGSA